MKYLYAFTLSFFSFSLLAMLESQSPKGWDPLTYSDPQILNNYLEYYRAQEFLKSIPCIYEPMRTHTFEKKYSYDSFVNLNINHIQRLRSIIQKFGWPSEEMFDSECTQGAFLIAQYANHNPEFQQSALKELEKIKVSVPANNMHSSQPLILQNKVN
ncbi:MAG: hypothetical protein AMXMBFR12_00020 [Candidatus Babeliales bacterium]